jgi:hypothetical protein
MLQNNGIATHGRLPRTVGADISVRYRPAARSAVPMIKLLPLLRVVDTGYRRSGAAIV